MADDDYEQLNMPGTVCLKELADRSDLEFWIVRMDPQVAAAELQGCKLPVANGKTSHSGGLKMCAETYIPPGMHVLLPNKKGHKLKPASLPLKGQINVHRPAPVISDDVTDEPVTSRTGPPQPPEDQPDRHPLLGVGYREELRQRKRRLELSRSYDNGGHGPATHRNKKKKKMVKVKEEI